MKTESESMRMIRVELLMTEYEAGELVSFLLVAAPFVYGNDEGRQTPMYALHRALTSAQKETLPIDQSQFVYRKSAGEFRYRD
jgi:hypothetical protein